MNTAQFIERDRSLECSCCSQPLKYRERVVSKRKSHREYRCENLACAMFFKAALITEVKRLARPKP